MDVFVVTEPFYDVCESWAEEPATALWDELYPIVVTWLVRSN